VKINTAQTTTCLSPTHSLHIAAVWQRVSQQLRLHEELVVEWWQDDRTMQRGLEHNEPWPTGQHKLRLSIMSLGRISGLTNDRRILGIAGMLYHWYQHGLIWSAACADTYTLKKEKKTKPKKNQTTPLRRMGTELVGIHLSLRRSGLCKVKQLYIGSELPPQPYTETSQSKCPVPQAWLAEVITGVGLS